MKYIYLVTAIYSTFLIGAQEPKIESMDIARKILMYVSPIGVEKPSTVWALIWCIDKVWPALGEEQKIQLHNLVEVAKRWLNLYRGNHKSGIISAYFTFHHVSNTTKNIIKMVLLGSGADRFVLDKNRPFLFSIDEYSNSTLEYADHRRIDTTKPIPENLKHEIEIILKGKLSPWMSLPCQNSKMPNYRVIKQLIGRFGSKGASVAVWAIKSSDCTIADLCAKSVSIFFNVDDFCEVTFLSMRNRPGRVTFYCDFYEKHLLQNITPALDADKTFIQTNINALRALESATDDKELPPAKRQKKA